MAARAESKLKVAVKTLDDFAESVYQAPQCTSSKDDPLNLEPISVLIVDDDETVGRLLARCCDEPDFKVIDVVGDRESALAVVRDHAPDVVLIDQRLGRATGVAVAGELLALAPSAKVIVVTGDPHPDVERAATAAGCWAVVGKTLTIAQDLPDLVRRAAAG